MRTIAILALLALTAPYPARAQPAAPPPTCAGLAEIEQWLAGKYAERLFWRGEEIRGGELRLYRNLATGTWTAVVVRGAGACAVAAGLRQFDGALPPPPGSEF